METLPLAALPADQGLRPRRFLLAAIALAGCELAGMAAVVTGYHSGESAVSNTSEFAWFWTGMLLLTLPLAGLVGRRATPSPIRTALLVLHGLVSYAPKLLRNPASPLYHDEFAHWRETCELLQKQGLAGEERLIALHPGSDWACRQWLPERWATLADALVARYGAAMVFTGTANEAVYVEDIRRRTEATSHSLVGQTTLPQMATLLSRSLLCICVESAIFEFTQATGTPAVVLAGPSRPGAGLYGGASRSSSGGYMMHLPARSRRVRPNTTRVMSSAAGTITAGWLVCARSASTTCSRPRKIRYGSVWQCRGRVWKA